METKSHKIDVNTILHTKDGRVVGNAIVIAVDGEYFKIKTDYGNLMTLTLREINEFFHVAWSHFSKEKDGYSCEEMQEKYSSNHKYRVKI